MLPFKLGITGSIGMGKTQTAKFFFQEGIPVWDADKAVHKLYNKGEDGYDAIKNFSNLYVNEKRMKQNLDNAGGLPMAEAFVIALGKTELGRQDAHELVRTITMDAEKEGISFAKAIQNNKEIKS